MSIPPPSSFPQAEFRAGVTACLRSWSAFRTAVESGWGGSERESVAKADDLRDNIYSVMNGSTARPTLEVEDLEDNLAIFMEEEFSLVLEDKSEQQVAATLFALYEQCVKGDTSLAHELVATAIRHDQQVASGMYPVQVQSPPEQEDDDDDSEMMDVGDSATSAPAALTPQQLTPLPAASSAEEYAAQSLFGKTKAKKELQPEQLPQEPEVPMVDEDGFAAVATKRRKPKV